LLQTPSVTLYTATQQFRGRFDSHGRRVGDCLADASTEVLALHEALRWNLLAEEYTPESVSNVTVRRDTILLAVPTDDVDPLRPRVPTQQVSISLAIGLFVVEGALHRRDSDPSHLSVYLGPQSRAFVPVTGAQVRYLPNPRGDTEASVVLVHTRAIEAWWQPPP
jgi:hypothetical protein